MTETKKQESKPKRNQIDRFDHAILSFAVAWAKQEQLGTGIPLSEAKRRVGRFLISLAFKLGATEEDIEVVNKDVSG